MMKVPVRRRGSWLSSSLGSWQMASVVGPFPSAEAGRQSFEILTSSEDVLVISRPLGERGMRELRLDSILAPRARAARSA
jgi:hypothetical protein